MERPKIHIRYYQDPEQQRVSHVNEWFEWMQQALTFEGQVKAIKSVLQYPGGNHLASTRALNSWCLKNKDKVLNPTPEVARILNRRRAAHEKLSSSGCNCSNGSSCGCHPG